MFLLEGLVLCDGALIGKMGAWNGMAFGMGIYPWNYTWDGKGLLHGTQTLGIRYLFSRYFWLQFIPHHPHWHLTPNWRAACDGQKKRH